MGVPGDGASDAARRRAEAQLAGGQYERAAAEARAGLATNPENPELLVTLASALTDLGDGRGACEAAERAISLAPEWARAHGALGDAHLIATRNGHAAFNAYNAAAQLDPHNYSHFLGRAQATLFLLPRRQVIEVRTKTRRKELLESAARDAEYALQLAPESALAHTVRGRVHLAAGEWWYANEAAKRALSINPTSSFALQTRGVALQHLGDVRGASEAFVSAGKQDPRSEHSIKHLRNLKVAAPASIVALWVASRFLFAIGENSGTAGMVFVAIVVAISSAVYLVWRARRAREMTPEARRALEVDRKLRRANALQRVRHWLPHRHR
jgi:tetratricopeptide (TPR) repeat protein